MALSPSTNWLNAMVYAATVKPRFLVKIWVGVGTTVKMLDGYSSTITAPACVASVQQLTRELDVLTRETSVTECSVTLHLDEWVEDLIVNNPLFGTRMRVSLGAQDLAEADFESYYTGTIDNVVMDDNTVTIRCKGADSHLNYKINWLSFLPTHPLTAMGAILGLLPSDLVDSASYDPSAAANAAIGHWLVSRGTLNYQWGTRSPGLGLPGESRKILDDLISMLNGTLRIAEDGRVAFKLFDATASAAAAWTDDDMDECEIIDTLAYLVNRAICVGHRLPDNDSDSDYETGYLANDTAAQARFSYYNDSTSAPFVRERRISMDWVTGWSNYWYSLVAGPAAVEDVLGTTDPETGRFYATGQVNRQTWSKVTSTSPLESTSDDVLRCHFASAMAGSRWPGFPGGAQPSYAQLSGTKKAYLQIEGEIIECDAAAPLASSLERIYALNEATSSIIGGTLISDDYPTIVDYTVSERGALGTSAAAHTSEGRLWPLSCYDITPMVGRAQGLVDRFANGAPLIRVTTSLAEYALQLGDLVTITTGRLRWYGHRGVTSSTKWEIVSKTIDLEASPPRLEWRLVFAGDASGLAVVNSYETRLRPRFVGKGNEAAQAAEGEAFWPYVVSGFSASSAGLDVTITAGVMGVATRRVPMLADYELTVDADSDTWLVWSMARGGFIVHTVARGAAQPSVGPGDIALFRFRSDATDVVRTDDYRVFAPLTYDTVSKGTLTQVETHPAGEQSTIVRNPFFSIQNDPTKAPNGWVCVEQAVGQKERFDEPARHNKAQGSFTATATPSLSLGFTPIEDVSFLVLAISMRTPATITSVVTTNVTWTAVDSEAATDRNLFLYVGRCTGGTPGTSIDVTLPANGHGAWIVAEYHGLDATPVGASSSTNGSSATAAASAVTPTTARALIIGVASMDDGDTAADFSSPGDDFTEVAQQKGTELPLSTAQTLVFCEKFTSVAEVSTFSIALDASDDWCAIGAVFDAATRTRDWVRDDTLFSQSETTEGIYVVSSESSGDVATKAATADKSVVVAREWDVAVLGSGVATEQLMPVTSGNALELRIIGAVDDLAEFFYAEAIFYTPDKKRQVGIETLSGVSVTSNTLFDEKIRFKVPTGAAWCKVVCYVLPIAADTVARFDTCTLRRLTPSFRIGRTNGGAQSVNSATVTVVEYDDVKHDDTDDWDAGNNAWVVPYQGDYRFEASAYLEGLDDGKLAYLMLYVDGAEVKRGPTVLSSKAGANVMLGVAQQSIRLDAGSVVDVRVYHDQGAALNLNFVSVSDAFSFSGAQTQ